MHRTCFSHIFMIKFLKINCSSKARWGQGEWILCMVSCPPYTTQAITKNEPVRPEPSEGWSCQNRPNTRPHRHEDVTQRRWPHVNAPTSPGSAELSAAREQGRDQWGTLLSIASKWTHLTGTHRPGFYSKFYIVFKNYWLLQSSPGGPLTPPSLPACVTGQTKNTM